MELLFFFTCFRQDSLSAVLKRAEGEIIAAGLVKRRRLEFIQRTTQHIHVHFLSHLLCTVIFDYAPAGAFFIYAAMRLSCLIPALMSAPDVVLSSFSTSRQRKEALMSCCTIPSKAGYLTAAWLSDYKGRERERESSDYLK